MLRLMASLGQYDDLRSEDDGRPVAAPLPVVAELLGVPLGRVLIAAGRVEPYRHADGSPRWSVRELELALGRRRTTPDERRALRRDLAVRGELLEAAEG